jgi:acetoacetyl-CoA synthetase
VILWNPTPFDLKDSRLARFRDLARKTTGLPFPDYASLHSWSTRAFQEFWLLWLQDAGLLYSGSPVPAYVSKSGTNDVLGGQWFPNLRLNFAENLMAKLAEVPLVGLDERGRRREWSRREVIERVRGLQIFLKEQGVAPGDRVAGVLPNVPEAVLAMLATTSLGAVWSSCSPDFGVQGIVDRLSQVKPKVVFLADGYSYNGKLLPLAEKNEAVLAALDSVRVKVMVPFLGDDEGSFDAFSRTDGLPVEFTRRPFAAPLVIMFSSGTTGKPKCIVHGTGGPLLQITKEWLLHCDLRPGERTLYYTTCGWMMWNWMTVALAGGASVHCYDGSPAYPNGGASMWELVAREQIAVFGTSAKFLASNRAEGLDLHARKDISLNELRLVLSTGSPLAPEDFDYFYAKLAPATRSLPLASISGGTDILSCFMLGNPLKPVIRGEIQGAGLGMRVEAYDDTGHAVIDRQGELVCTRPFPSQPVGFLDDPGDAKYRKAYFERFPGVWHHGDYVTVRPEGGIVVHGRSDTTLNPGGVRLGTAEIYRLVESHPAVQDSLVVGQQWQGDERVVLFVKLKSGETELSEDLVRDLKARIREGATPRHVPAILKAVREIPYTVSGKKVELAVKQILHGAEPKNVEALANPASLDEYRKFSGAGGV